MRAMHAFTDWILGTSSRQGTSSEDFRAFYDEYRGYVWKVAYWLAGESAADDIVQETFVKAWRASFRGESSRKTWIHRIAVNCAYDHLRKRQRDARDLSEALPAQLAANPEATLAMRAIIRAGIASLPEKQRAAFVLYYQQDFSLEETAECLELPAGTVKSRLHHGRAAFIEFLKKHGVTYE